MKQLKINHLYLYNIKSSIILLITAFFLTNCSNNSVSENTTSVESSVENTTSEIHPGALSYKKYCASCHQTNGEGIQGLYPPIKETETVNGDKHVLIGIILNGMSGETEVKGQTYNGTMSSYEYLTDQEIADLLSYVRSNFNNSSESITAEEVKEVRESLQ